MSTQFKNRSFSARPKQGDGTQLERHSTPDANWFGASREPQEEFIEGSPPPPDPDEQQKAEQTSEGLPTFESDAST